MAVLKCPFIFIRRFRCKSLHIEQFLVGVEMQVKGLFGILFCGSPLWVVAAVVVGVASLLFSASPTKILTWTNRKTGDGMQQAALVQRKRSLPSPRWRSGGFPLSRFKGHSVWLS